MKRDELTELHFITPYANLPTLLQYGIQSHRRAEVGRRKGILQIASVAMQEVQSRRAGIHVPGGRELHKYANLYLCARNPMMFKRKAQHKELCVLRIDTAVLDIEGAIITDRNAASIICRFAAAPGGLSIIDKELVFAANWNHDEEIEKRRHKAIKCAEVLIPDQVPPVHIMGAYVSCREVVERVKEIVPELSVTTNGFLFFYEEP